MTDEAVFPIPVHGVCRGKKHAGSAFLVKGAHSTWLVSCAHLISGVIETPNQKDVFEGGAVHILGTDISIPIELDKSGRFNVVQGVTEGILADVMALKISDQDLVVLRRFGSFLLSHISDVEVGEKVHIQGFPGLSETPVLPQTFEAEVVKVAVENFSISKPSATGYSGGPVISKRGLVGVVAGDVGTSPNFIEGIATSMKAVSRSLFIE